MNITQLLELSQAVSDTGGTSLVTIMVTPNTAITNVVGQIKSELATSQNIKNKNVRQCVHDALQSCLHMLKMSLLHHSPENGLVICAGLCISYF